MSHHLTLVGECSHRINGASAWRMYALKDENGVFYNGYRCLLCKAEGYGIPRAQDQPKDTAGVATTVGGAKGRRPAPPTPEEWKDHLDEEHREDV